MKKTILILYNKISKNPSEDELDVLEQVKMVSSALVDMDYQVKELQLDMNLEKAIREIEKINPYIVFNLVESINNKGEFAYFAPSLLSSLNIPFTGNPLVPMFISANKVMAKKELKRLKIPTPGWLMTDEMSKIRKNKKYILKPVWEEGSLGLDEDSIFDGSNGDYIEKVALKDKQYYFVEEFIEGREFNVSILGTKEGPKVLPMAEMTFLKFPEGKPKIMGYTAKWKEDSFEYTHTRRTFKIPKSDQDINDKIREICEKCWNEIGFKGYVRIDFRVSADRVPYVIDLNLNPCISLSGGFVAASEKAGYKFIQIVQYLLDEAFRK
ncbi:MAG: ATP-grasp domain-containing protein [Bacteroidota bacterium]